MSVEPSKSNIIPMRPRRAATAGMSPSPFTGKRLMGNGQLIDIEWLRQLCGRMRRAGLPIDLASERAKRRPAGGGGHVA